MGTNTDPEQLEGIAVIGMAGRFPGAASVDRFWQNLVNGIESVSSFSNAQLLSAGVDPDLLRLPNYVKAGIVLDGVDLFDADFFGFSPREAECTDPQQRVFLECAWEALESAGYDAEQYAGHIGVFAGTGDSDYQSILASNPRLLKLLPDLQRSIAVQKDFLATRVSYKLNLRGPSLCVQTACSTSLVAVHLGCQSLLNEESDMVLAGGVSIRLSQGLGYLHLDGHILSPDGHCRAFDAAAHGTVIGSGAGVVVLKRLADALADRDTIHAVIRGTAINNDGAGKAGYTAPSVDGQAGVIAEAQAVAGVTADSISYVETHGTGTALGDPIEIDALTRAFRMTTEKKHFCSIGSVKTNIGHLDVAAGIAGLIKVVLALEHKEIPPSLNFERPNPASDFASSPFHVQRTHSKWAPEGRRLAGVSSFGIGGTNAHAVVEEAPLVASSPAAVPWQLLTLSAKSPGALEKASDQLADFIASHPEANLAEVAFTLQKGRKAFAHRRALAARDNGEAVNLLRSRDSRRVHTGKAAEEQPGVIFLFPAQGAQYVNMGRDLYESEPLFREEVDRCATFLKSPLGLDIRTVIYPQDAEGASEQLKQTRFTQPAVFTIDYALARLWMSWGVSPAAMAGHSLGEYVAATLAGVFELEDALKLVAERARLMQEQPPGSMLAVYLGEPELKRWLSEEVALAAVNAPGLCVVSGPVESIKGLNEALSAEKIKTQLLQTSHAFHSGMMAPVVTRFVERVAQTPRRAPRIPVVSTLTGTWLSGAEALDPAYWGRQLRYGVRFGPAMQELLKTPNRVFLEVGPGNALSVLARLHLSGEGQPLVLGSLRHAKETRSDREVLRSAVGSLWVAGVPIAGEKLVGQEQHRRVALPTYCFERKRYWIAPGLVEAPESVQVAAIALVTSRGSTSETSVPSAETQLPAQEPAGSAVRVNGARYARPELANNYVPPQTATETALAKLWEYLLGVTGIGIHDDFFELGGHSLLAVTLMSEIGKQFGTQLPLAALIQAPTIHRFAPLVQVRQTEPPWSSLVPLNQEGAGPPLFLMHSHGGNVLEYYPLAHRLGKSRKVYALQARGLDGSLPCNLTIEKMASYYLKEITATQPAGPYYLGGYCLGGCLAIEAARQLRAQKEEVSLVTLINCSTSEYPKYLPETNSVRRWLFSCSARLGFEWGELAGKAYPRKLAHLLARSRRFGDLARAKAEMFLDKWPALRSRLLKKHSLIYYWELLAMAHYSAWVAYQPKPYDGKVLFIRAQKQPRGIYPDPLLGWAEKLTGKVTVHEIPGVQQTILSEPNVGIVASLLDEMLAHANGELGGRAVFATN
jgi:phthiocerol/phenolphthiocerol synthesis type-I polyketide synthase E